MHAPDEPVEVEPIVHRQEVHQSTPSVTPEEEGKPEGEEDQR